MTRDDEIKDKALKTYPFDWARGIDLNAGGRFGFEFGAHYADSTSPYKKALERAVEAFKEIFSDCTHNTPESAKAQARASAKRALDEIQKLLEGKES